MRPGWPCPPGATLDTSWTRWIVEPPGYGTDEKGDHYSDLSYWNLCGDGATTVTLWYWQQLTGGPDVTGTAGYFLDPYANEARGLAERRADRCRLGRAAARHVLVRLGHGQRLHGPRPRLRDVPGDGRSTGDVAVDRAVRLRP